jgi:hypothetical protein
VSLCGFASAEDNERKIGGIPPHRELTDRNREAQREQVDVLRHVEIDDPRLCGTAEDDVLATQNTCL